MEIWRSVLGYPDFEVSNLGNVRKINGGKASISTHPAGYLKVAVGKTKRSTQLKLYIHRVVSIAFLPNPENLPDVNHKNGIKNDNRVENLEWCTRSYNMKHAFDTGLAISKKGEDSLRSKLSNEDIFMIRALSLGWTGFTTKTLALMHNVSSPQIRVIKFRRGWTHV